MIEGAAGVSSPYNQSGALVRGIREADLKRLPGIAGHVKLGTLDGFDTAGGVAIGQRLAESLALRVGDTISVLTAKGAADAVRRRAAHQELSGRWRSSRSACRSSTASFVYMPLDRGAGLLQQGRRGDRHRGLRRRSRPHGRDARASSTRPSSRPDDHDRLAPAQQDLLRRAERRAQRHVHHPDADRAGGGAQHHLRPDHAGEGQGPRHRHPAHHGRDARRDPAHLPDHRRLDRRRRARSRASLLGVLVAQQHRGDPRVPQLRSCTPTCFRPSSISCRTCPRVVEPGDVAGRRRDGARRCRSWPRSIRPGGPPRSIRSKRCGTNDGVRRPRSTLAKVERRYRAGRRRRSRSCAAPISRSGRASRWRWWRRRAPASRRCCMSRACSRSPTPARSSSARRRRPRMADARAHGAAPHRDRLRLPVPSPAAGVLGARERRACRR